MSSKFIPYNSFTYDDVIQKTNSINFSKAPPNPEIDVYFYFSYALRIYVFFFFSLWKQQAPGWLWCLQQMFMTIYYTHFSVNFLLYAIGGATFRRCLANIFNKFLFKFSHYGRRACPVSRPIPQEK